MSTVLGKRKKAGAEPATNNGSEAPTAVVDKAAIQAIFQRHFEAQFQPLAAGKAKKKQSKAAARAAREESDDGDSSSGSDGEEDGDSDDSGSDSGSSWSGLGDDAEEEEDNEARPAVEVVDYSQPSPGAVGSRDAFDAAATMLSKRERKLYLSSRPPNAFDEDKDDNKNKRKQRRGGRRDADDDNDDAAPTYKDAPDLLANDLALQRLISESHLLAGAFRLPSSVSTSAGAVAGAAGSAGSATAAPFAAGRLRQRTTDLRIQAVAHKGRGAAGALAGAAASSSSSPSLLLPVHNPKDSIFTQAKMSMAQRKGMTATAAAREAKRRQEARESGIVLERPAKKLQPKPAKGERRLLRAVDAPAIGKLRGSELKLRDRDVRAIEGPRRNAGPNKKRR